MKTGGNYIVANQDVDTSFLALDIIWRGMCDRRIQDQIGTRIMYADSFCEVVKGDIVNYYTDATWLKTFVALCVEKIRNDKALLPKLKAGTEESARKMRERARVLLPEVPALDLEGCATALREIDRLQRECVYFGTVIAFTDTLGDLTSQLMEIVHKRKNLTKSIPLYTNVLALPKEKSFSQKAYEDIANGSKTDGQLVEEYFWLNQGYIGRGLTVKELTHVRDSYTESAEEVSREELLAELQLTPDEEHLFSIARDLVYAKALRADSRQFLYVVMNRILDRISEKLAVSSRHLAVLSMDELLGVFRGVPLPTNLEERALHSVHTIGSDGKYHTRIGKDADAFLEENLLDEVKNNGGEVRGQVAFTGKARGVARLVFGPQHNGKVRRGDILIAPSTSPQLLSAMRLAGAFVTDVGGITSHAAIVAREFKIPCIVGTKIATQVFRDGDMVEVDADEGVIKRI